MKPAIFDSFAILLLVLEVTLEDLRALEADLATRIWLVLTGVAHLRDISQPHLGARDWASNVSSDGITRFGDAGGSAGLSLSIPFKDGTAEGDLEEVKDIDTDWSGTCCHDSDITTKNRLELAADYFIVEAIVILRIILQIEEL